MTTRRIFLKQMLAGTARTGIVLASAGLLIPIFGCGGSMAGSSFAFSMTGLTGYGGNPKVTIKQDQGSGIQGTFSVDGASPVLRANESVFVQASFQVEIPSANSNYYTKDPTPPIGFMEVQWSEVPDASGNTLLTLNSPVGVTFAGYEPSPDPNVRVSAQSGNFFVAKGPGTVTLKFHVTLHASDGSTTDHDFQAKLVITS